MRERDIKRQAVKQREKEFPDLRCLPRKGKKWLTKEVFQNLIVQSCSSEQATAIPVHELTNTPIPMPGMTKLSEMEQLLEATTRSLLGFCPIFQINGK
jgi:hypothetical protein